MISVKFPEPQFRVKMENGKRFIFDGIRKTWLLLTEEEWVRQNFVAYLVNMVHYPAAMIAVEKEIQLHGLKKRFDILVYNKQHEPWLMIECKAPSVPLNEDVLQQVLRYNISTPVNFVVITNGTATLGWKKQAGRLELLHGMPAWE